MNEACPISHIPIAEIKHPVTFASERKNLIVYTNHRISLGFAHEILRPCHADDKATIELLLKTGFLNGEGGKVFFSFELKKNAA